MLATEVKGLRAIYSDVEQSASDAHYGGWADDSSVAWRVMIIDANCVFPMKFARERDALAAIAAVADMGDWVNDWRRLVQDYPKQIRERFLGAMQW